jgi:hypothetical protein
VVTFKADDPGGQRRRLILLKIFRLKGNRVGNDGHNRVAVRPQLDQIVQVCRLESADEDELGTGREEAGGQLV